jgi:subtilisin family serine protease
VIIEPECYRQPARFALAAAFVPQPSSAGFGAAFGITVRSARGPSVNSSVELIFSNLQTGATVVVKGFTDAQGRAAVPYDPGTWRPATVIVTPRSGQWSWWMSSPPSSGVLQLADLPRAGPLGWWHQLLGIASYKPQRGQGIRIGLADTGVGPHPYLSHIQSAGAFLNGGHDASPAAANDVSEHGTHTAGVIGARPPAASSDFAGIAPAADVVVARVYGDSASTATNGDIAAAIDALAAGHPCDLINLSLGGTEQSEIELDSVTAAIEAGALVLGAAGNANGPIDYPAAYPGVVAVSALGLTGAFPSNAVDALAVPTAADRFVGSLFEAGFNNTGPHMACTAPGVGIISTVPGDTPAEAAYAAMSGTSMACPAVCAALATLLSNDPNYRKLPRNTARAQYAWNVLLRSLRRLGLNNTYEGFGLASGV